MWSEPAAPAPADPPPPDLWWCAPPSPPRLALVDCAALSSSTGEWLDLDALTLELYLGEVDSPPPLPPTPPPPPESVEPQYCSARGDFPCLYPGCGRAHAKLSHARAHLRRHRGDKPYRCSWPGCVWRFSRSDELARHHRSHSGDKPYACALCTKRFARSDHRAKHARVHARRAARAAAARKAQAA